MSLIVHPPLNRLLCTMITINARKKQAKARALDMGCGRGGQGKQLEGQRSSTDSTELVLHSLLRNSANAFIVLVFAREQGVGVARAVMRAVYIPRGRHINEETAKEG